MSREMARGAAWMVLFRLVDRSIGFVSTAILARLLVPADFGLVAMAMSIIAVVELATAFGFDIVLIQKSDPQREHFDTAWTMNLAIGVACAIVIATASVPAAAFYGDPRLTPLMLTIAAAWLLYGLENTGTANFRREMNFAAEFRFMAFKRMAGFVCTMAAAFAFRSYWALVVGMICGRVAGVALSFVMHPFRPRLSLSKASELFRFSGWLLVNNLLGVLLSKVPHLYVGRHFGAGGVGAYTVSAEIAALAHTELIAPINRAMFPGYSKLVAQPEEFKRTCMNATAFILMLVIPVCVGIAVLAGPFVRLVLGAQWSMAVPLIQILALAGAMSALTANNIAAYLALGRPHLATSILAVRLGVLAAGMYLLAARFGIVGVAYAEVIAASASMMVSLPTLFVTFKFSLKAYLASFWRPVIASIGMGFLINGLLSPGFAHDHAGSALVELVCGVAVGVICYPLAMLVLWFLAGRPDAMEMFIFRRVGTAVSAWVARS